MHRKPRAIIIDLLAAEKRMAKKDNGRRPRMSEQRHNLFMNACCVCECVHACGGMREMSKKNDNGEEREEIRNGSCMNS